MKIILTGEPGIGKTTIIKKLLQRLGNRVIGFWTEEVRDKKNQKENGL
jgi:nucleoside-triphosphatase